MSETAKKFFVWTVAAFLLLILTDFYPNMAKGLLGLLVLGVLLANYGKYTDLIKGATK